jgi:DNA-binding IscR family transcriptional regulator
MITENEPGTVALSTTQLLNRIETAIIMSRFARHDKASIMKLAGLRIESKADRHQVDEVFKKLKIRGIVKYRRGHQLWERQ